MVQKIKLDQDNINEDILRKLCADSQITYKKIADSQKVTSQTISDRIRNLQDKSKIIQYFTIKIDPEKLGYPLEFICELDINASVMQNVLDELKKIAEIHLIRITTGIHDIFCLGNASSVENLYKIVEERISVIPGVNKTYTSITMKKVKDNQVLNLNEK
jgi:Lrp/AsnC family transcriptional regulator for asnA, asnC and gidA